MMAADKGDGLRILVTGGAGFIGSALIRHLIGETKHQVLNFDKLSYAGSLASLESAAISDRYCFVRADINDSQSVHHALGTFRPNIVTHLAAESHVDRSIDRPSEFIQTNIVGTFTLLSETLRYWKILPQAERDAFRFHHISTDEVFGSLGSNGRFTERSQYDPRSPYSASKASSDHLVRAWHHTYDLPVLLTNCSNNYGPYHHPEKLIPQMIIKCLKGEPLPIYGTGTNVRDWLYVEDHARALTRIFESARIGETYLIGGRSERTNIQVVNSICAIIDRLCPRRDGQSHRIQIAHVEDRPGHDLRYAVDPSKLERELGWAPSHNFENALERTVRWYLQNQDWWESHLNSDYVGQRLGLAI